MPLQSKAKNPPVHPGLLQLLALAFMLLVACPRVKAQESTEGSDSAERTSRRSIASLLQSPGALDFIDLSAASPGGRPRGALRFRFESATRALRGFGVDADECRTLLRTTSNRVAQSAGGSEGSTRLGVVVSLNCSFF